MTRSPSPKIPKNPQKSPFPPPRQDRISGDFRKPQIKLFRYNRSNFCPTSFLHGVIWARKSDVFAKKRIFLLRRHSLRKQSIQDSEFSYLAYYTSQIKISKTCGRNRPYLFYFSQYKGCKIGRFYEKVSSTSICISHI